MHQTIRKVNDAQRDNVTLTVPTAVLPATALALTKKTDAQECAYNLSNEALAKEYIKQAKALLPQVKDFLALDKEIGSRFRRLKQDETILGYKTLEELCRKELGIGARALQYRNAGGNPVSKRNKPKPRPLPLPPAPIERETVSSSLCDDSADLEQLLEDTAIRDYIDIRSEFYAWVIDHFEFDHDPCAPDGDGTMQFRRLWDALVDHPYDERTDIDADWLDVWWKDFHPRRKRNEAGELPPQPKMTLEEFVTRIFKEAKLPEETGKNTAIGSPQSDAKGSSETTAPSAKPTQKELKQLKHETHEAWVELENIHAGIPGDLEAALKKHEEAAARELAALALVLPVAGKEEKPTENIAIGSPQSDVQVPADTTAASEISTLVGGWTLTEEEHRKLSGLLRRYEHSDGRKIVQSQNEDKDGNLIDTFRYVTRDQWGALSESDSLEEAKKWYRESVSQEDVLNQADDLAIRIMQGKKDDNYESAAKEYLADRRIPLPDYEGDEAEESGNKRKPEYLITIRIAASRLSAVEKQAKEVFGDKLKSVTKVARGMSRAAELAEAEELVGQAKEIVEELKGQMEERRDNTPENFQCTDTYSEVEACVDALESLESDLENISFDSIEFPGW